MPSPPPMLVKRRQVLAGSAALVALGMVTGACSSPPAPPAVDELLPQLELARRDTALAAAAAATARPALRAALAEVAEERSAHATALAAEIDRVAPTPIVRSSTSSTSPTTTSSTSAPPPTVSEVVNALHASADSASRLAATSSGYRAGLLGSIAAACTASYSVALVFGEPTP
ncbi:MAG: hypothetical protein K2Q25_02575 [Mycobacteriaceae bacterium]|nr:hypothetical protein [Mycobacteriaceae bacterium]